MPAFDGEHLLNIHQNVGIKSASKAVSTENMATTASILDAILNVNNSLMTDNISAVMAHKNGTEIDQFSTFATANGTVFDDELLPTMGAGFGPDQIPVFLHLRYYARHFIPIFCAIGIIGNCMALLLIRFSFICIPLRLF